MPRNPAILSAVKQYRFRAKIEAADGGGAGVLFPYDVEKEFGTTARVPVKVTFDGVPYAGSLIRCGTPQHMLPMLKAIREQLGKSPGDTVEVTLTKDESVRNIDVPPEFAALMEKEGLTSFFESLSYTHRKEYCRWISEAKKEEMRTKRLEKAVDMPHKGIRTPG